MGTHSSHRFESRGTGALLRDGTFGPFFAGNLISNSGSWLHNVAAAVVVYEMTGSAAMVGGVTAALWIASLVLQPWAGGLSDRVDRKRMLIQAQLLAASAGAVLATWTALVGVDGLPGPWPVLGATFVIGVGFAFSIPAMQALVPALVPESDLEQAVALNSLTFNLGRAFGPALGAVTMATLGAAAAFAFNAVSYLALIGVLLVIRPGKQARSTRTDGSVRAGLRYVRGEPVVLVLLVGVTALGFGTDPSNTLTPPIAERLGGGDALVGWLVSSFGIGAAAAAMIVRPLRRRFDMPHLACAGLTTLGVSMLMLAVSPTVPFALASLVLSGVGFLVAITALTTLLYRVVPDQLRGRVMSLWGVAFLGSRPVAALLQGTVADVVSTAAGVAVAAASALGAAVLLWTRVAARPSTDG